MKREAQLEALFGQLYKVNCDALVTGMMFPICVVIMKSMTVTVVTVNNQGHLSV